MRTYFHYLCAKCVLCPDVVLCVAVSECVNVGSWCFITVQLGLNASVWQPFFETGQSLLYVKPFPVFLY